MAPEDFVEANLTIEAIVEELAAIEHDRWSHWQRYLHDQCSKLPDGSLTIPAHLVRKWATQMATSYADLTEAEKDSDREQVARYLPVLDRYLGHGSGT